MLRVTSPKQFFKNKNQLVVDTKQEHIYKPFFQNTYRYYVQTDKRRVLRNWLQSGFSQFIIIGYLRLI